MKSKSRVILLAFAIASIASCTNRTQPINQQIPYSQYSNDWNDNQPYIDNGGGYYNSTNHNYYNRNGQTMSVTQRNQYLNKKYDYIKRQKYLKRQRQEQVRRYQIAKRNSINKNSNQNRNSYNNTNKKPSRNNYFTSRNNRNSYSNSSSRPNKSSKR
jgi:hypothetical protein